MNKAVIYANPPTIETEVVQLPVPEPGFGQVLVRLSYSGVCHTDYGFCTNGFSTLPAPTPKGQVGGHEGIGNVVKQGPGVLSPAVGDLVGVKFAASACLNCDNCLIGGETSCPNGTVSGYFTPGTFQQYCLGQASYVTPIPDDLDPAGAAALMCGGVTVYTALKRAKLQHGQWVVVSGAGGGLGHLAIQYATAMGAKVLAIDHGSKEQFCLDLGAKAFLDYTQFSTTESLVAQVQQTTIAGANIVLACFSSNSAYAQAVSFLGFRGILVCLGVPEGPPVPIGGAIVGDMITKELTIFAIKSGNRLDTKECLQLAADKGIKTSYTLRPMDDLTQIFEEMKDGKITGRAILDLR